MGHFKKIDQENVEIKENRNVYMEKDFIELSKMIDKSIKTIIDKNRCLLGF